MGNWHEPNKPFTWGFEVQSPLIRTDINEIDKPRVCASCNREILDERLISAESAETRVYYHSDCAAGVLFRYAKYAQQQRALIAPEKE